MKMFWEVENDNCLTRSKLCRGELGSSIYREIPTVGGFSCSTNYISSR